MATVNVIVKVMVIIMFRVGVRVNNPNLENNPRLTLTPDIALCLYIVFPRDFDGCEAV